MPQLDHDPYAQYSEGTSFTYYGRVLKFRREDSPAGHKETIGAHPDTFVGQYVVEIEGISVEWIGEDGNLRRTTADYMKNDGSPKAGRGGNTKWGALLAPIIAPTDATAALKAGFRKRDPTGKSWVGAPGLGYDGRAGDFPECLEGHIFYIENRRTEFGTNRQTGEPIAVYTPAFLRREDDYVHEGTPTQISYGERAAVTPDAGEASASAVDAPVPTPDEFFEAISGVRNDKYALLEAVQAAGVDCEPYRTLVLGRAGTQPLVDAGLIEIDPGTQIIKVTGDLSKLETSDDLVDKLKEEK